MRPKDEEGIPVTDLGKAVVDFNTSMAGIQEGKEWLALVKYLQQFAPAEEGGLPVIPPYYKNPRKVTCKSQQEKVIRARHTPFFIRFFNRYSKTGLKSHFHIVFTNA